MIINSVKPNERQKSEPNEHIAKKSPLNKKMAEGAGNICNMKRLWAFLAVLFQLIARKSLGLPMRRTCIILERTGFKV